MIIEFKFSNFRSFSDEQAFSLVASSDTSLPDNIISTEAFSKKILRSSVIYGANASGKSNFYNALLFTKAFIVTSTDRKQRELIPIKPFLFSKEKRKELSEFEITFIHEDVRYQYGFSLDQDRIYEEWLTAYPKGLPQTWFERKPSKNETDNHSEWHFGTHLKGEKKRLANLTRIDALYLTVAAKFEQKQLAKVFEWFDDYLRFFTADDLIPDFTILGLENIYENKNIKNFYVDFLQKYDIGISDLQVTKRKAKQTDFPKDMPEELKKYLYSPGDEILNINLFHQTEENKNSGSPLEFGEESIGTQRLFSIIYPWVLSLDKGFSFIVDELDASLHPLIVRDLISLFHIPEINTGNGQLVFNTHDTTLLDPSLFRRDQIWFVEKDNGGKSHLYPLLDFSPRKDENLEKGYLRGRYGGIPFLKGEVEGLFGNGKT